MKEKISKEKGWETSQQKLIYSGKMSICSLGKMDFALSSVKLMFLGKILQDANTVESYSIEEKGFIVCMISKVENPEYL